MDPVSFFKCIASEAPGAYMNSSNNACRTLIIQRICNTCHHYLDLKPRTTGRLSKVHQSPDRYVTTAETTSKGVESLVSPSTEISRHV